MRFLSAGWLVQKMPAEKDRFTQDFHDGIAVILSRGILC